MATRKLLTPRDPRAPSKYIFCLSKPFSQASLFARASIVFARASPLSRPIKMALQANTHLQTPAYASHLRDASVTGSHRTTPGNSLAGANVTLTWGGQTFYGPTYVESNKDTALNCYYFSTRESNISVSSAANRVKLNAFTSLFNVVHTMLREVSHNTRLILNPDNPSLDLTSAAVFQLINGTVLDSRGKLFNNFVSRVVADAAGVLTATLGNMKKARYAAAPPCQCGQRRHPVLFYVV